MTRPSTVPTFATDATYPSDAGPDAGTANKIVAPGGYQATGLRRDGPVIAQYENSWKNLVGSWLDWLSKITGDDGSVAGDAVVVQPRLDLKNAGNQLLGGLLARGSGPGFVGRPAVTCFDDSTHTYDLTQGELFLVPSLTANRSYKILDTGIVSGKVITFAFTGNAFSHFATLVNNDNSPVAVPAGLFSSPDVGANAGSYSGKLLWADLVTSGTANSWRVIRWYLAP